MRQRLLTFALVVGCAALFAVSAILTMAEDKKHRSSRSKIRIKKLLTETATTMRSFWMASLPKITETGM